MMLLPPLRILVVELLLLLLLGVAVAAPTKQQKNATKISSLVDLGYARYQGVSLPAVGVNQYLGLRFAAPPLGELRFAAPADPLPENTTQDASQQGPICYGVGEGLASGQAEDCLFLDVFSPSNATEQSKLPVFFWITGGGYVQNSNSDYNGTDLVTTSGGNIVVVNFNYRVGPFGFLASESVRRRGALNAGLLDQRKALQWVQTYITKFGGDPDHVVIVGASAGAGSVALQLAAYGGRNDNLFVGAIGESTFFPTQRTVPELEFQFTAFANASGCSSSTGDRLGCLRNQSTETLQNANQGFPYPGRTNAPEFSYAPCIDGDLIRDIPYREFEAGHFINVPIIFGNDNNEGTAFAVNASSPADISSFFQDNYPKLTANQTAAINAQYPLSANPPLPAHAEYFAAAAAAYGESTFTCPALMITGSHRQKTAWAYRYHLLDPSNVAQGLGTPHTYEIPAVWGTDSNAGGGGGGSSYDSINAPVIPLVMNYWISFVRALDPNLYRKAGAPVWESVGSNGRGSGGGGMAGANQRRLLFQNGGIANTTMETVEPAQQARCAFWKGLAGTMEQ